MFKAGLKLVMRSFVAAVLAVTIGPFVVRAGTAALYRGAAYTPERAPERPVAIVFGARVYSSGRPSAMLADRVSAAAELYQAGKVDVLLMSGDGRTSTYNEPLAMKQYAMSLGVPESAIWIDEAGLRSYDTCYRARHVFAVEHAVVVTQNFHLDRVLLLCNGLGVQAVGVFADTQRPWGYAPSSLNYSRLREIPATVVALIDLIRREPPASVQALS